MRKNVKLVSMFWICLLLLSISGKLHAQAVIKVCVGGEVELTGHGNDNCRNYEWDVAGGTIVYGKGTNSIVLTFPSAGDKTVKLNYHKAGGTAGNETFNVTVYAKLVFDPIIGDTVCAGGQFNPKVPNIRGEYESESGKWWLDGNVIEIGKVLTLSDDGKLLKYSVETPYGRVYSPSKALKVKGKPAILSINGLSAEVSSGGTLHASVDINPNDNDNTIRYAWTLGNTVVGNTKEIDYKVGSDDNGKVMSVRVSNGCESNTASHLITSKTVQTGINPAFLSKVPVPESFMIRDFDPDKDAHSLPDKYWENKNYRFYTNNTSYKEGTSAWFSYDKSKSGWVPSDGAGYEFKVFRAPTNMNDIPRENNTTILLDYRDVYLVDVTTDPSTYFFLFRNSSGYAYNCKIFGLKCVTNGVVDENKKVTIKFTSNDPNVDLPTGVRIQSVSDCVAENIKFDGNNRTFYNYFLDVIDGEGGDSNNDYLILKDLTISNAKCKVMDDRPRSIIVFIAQNRRTSTSLVHVRNQRYIYNLNIDASCRGVSGPGTGTNAAIYVYGSDNLYFDRVTLGSVPGRDGFDKGLLIGRGRGGPDYLALKDSRNIIIKEFVGHFDSIQFSHTYEHRNIVVPANEYRYFQYAPDEIYSIKAYNDLGQFTPNSIVYDRETGYFLVPASMATSNLKELQKLYKNYLDAGVVGPGTVDGCPAPNILLIADGENGEISGFTIPDFGIGNVPVNIVAVAPDYLFDPLQDSDVMWTYNPQTPIVFETARAAQKVSLYNIDFSRSNYFIDNPWKNATQGTFYNCIVNSHVESENANDLLTVKLGTALDAFDNTGVDIVAKNGNIEVQSTDALIRQIDCYDLQGRLIVTKAGIDGNVYSIAAPSGNQAIIVKVKTDKHVKVKKVLAN